MQIFDCCEPDVLFILLFLYSLPESAVSVISYGMIRAHLPTFWVAGLQLTAPTRSRLPVSYSSSRSPVTHVSTFLVIVDSLLQRLNGIPNHDQFQSSAKVACSWPFLPCLPPMILSYLVCMMLWMLKVSMLRTNQTYLKYILVKYDTRVYPLHFFAACVFFAPCLPASADIACAWCATSSTQG